MSFLNAPAGEKELRFYQVILEWGPVALGIAAVLSALLFLFGNGDEFYYLVAHNSFVALSVYNGFVVLAVPVFGLIAPNFSKLSISNARIAERSLFWIGVLTLLSILAFLLESGSQENALFAVIVFAVLFVFNRLFGFNDSNGNNES